MTNFLSPITGAPADIVAELETGYIIQLYNDILYCDVRRFFANNKTIYLCKCPESKYEFFAPSTVAGDSLFYEELYSHPQNREWSYVDNRWEFDYIPHILPRPGRLLDIGCGGGSFLNKIKCYADETIGLESNPFGIAEAKRKNLRVENEDIATHSRTYCEYYDTVTALQVLEHVYDVASFVKSCTNALRPGGRLIMSVPNNDSFVGNDLYLPLNLPPHHMGRWRLDSLSGLANFFDLDFRGVVIEPLQKNLLGWYKSSMEREFIRTQNRVMRLLYYRMGFSNIFQHFLEKNCHTIFGHTMLAHYEKVMPCRRPRSNQP